MADQQAADLSRASAMIDLGRYGDAASLLATVLASAPGTSRGWCLLSRAHLGGGNSAEAVAAAARASALDPADDWPYRLVSTALIGMGQTADAVTAAQEARKLAPHFWRSHVCLAQAATAHGQHELAAQAAATALTLAPDVADVHVTAGKAALGRGDVAEARRWQESALAIEPTHSGAINELGRISLRSRDAAAAASHFLRAARTSPGSGVFGRNTELALRRVALRLAGSAILIAAAAACLVLAALAGSVQLAIAFAVPLSLLAGRAVREIRRLPPAGRSHLLRLVWARRARLGRDMKAAAYRPRGRGYPQPQTITKHLIPGTGPLAADAATTLGTALTGGVAPPRWRKRPEPPDSLPSVDGLGLIADIPVSGESGRALPADRLAATAVGKLAAVMYKEAARTGELVRLTRNHPERELLVRKVCTGKLKRLSNVIRIDVNRRRGLVHPPRLQFLQAVLGNVVVCFPRAVVVGSHVGPYPSIFTNLVARL